MDKHSQKSRGHLGITNGFLAGVLLGSLTGAGAMLLLAPQSGKRTRARLQQQSIELRDQATEGWGEAVAQIGATAREITYSISDKAVELQQRGQDMLDDQRAHLSAFGGEAKKVLQGARSQ